MPTFDENSALRHILNGTAAETGARFFNALVSNVATVFDTDFAWVTEYLADTQRLRALAFVQDGKLIDDFEYDILGTPCEPVIQGARLIHHPTDVQACYPQDQDLKELGMESYLGIPLLALDGTEVTFEATCRLDTPVEVQYYRNGGILHTVLLRMAESA